MLVAQKASQVFMAGALTWLASKLPSMITCRCALALSSVKACRRVATLSISTFIRWRMVAAIRPFLS
jgi:hypothetical protein